MFDRLELSPELSRYLVSISPMLGISGNLEAHNLHVITNYFALKEAKLIVDICSVSAPNEISFNLLRRGEDSILIAAYSKEQLDKNNLQKGVKINAPIYVNSVISFEAILERTIDFNEGSSLAIYKIVHVSGVAGLDPDFNDDVTIAKTIEVMTLSAVDTYVIEKNWLGKKG